MRMKVFMTQALEKEGVFEPEPVPPDYPILTLGNVVFTFHLGTSTIGVRVRRA
jgi:phosphoglycerate dehydrogenase-like enzyme